jgi:hypothetical protein
MRKRPRKKSWIFRKNEPPKAQQNFRLLGDCSEDEMIKRHFSAGLSENILT